LKGWTDIGDYFVRRIDDYVGKGRCMGGLSQGIIGNSQTDSSKIVSIYNYVCDSIKTNTSGSYFDNDEICDLVEKRVGTSDEKNVLLVELAKRAGLEAWPVLISTRSHGIFNPKIYQLSQLNHMIAFVVFDSVGMFLDASSQYCPFGMLPPSCLVHKGFLLNEESSEIVNVATKQPRTYRMDNTVVNVDSEGIAHCTTTVNFMGYFSPYYGLKYDTYEPEEFVEEYFVGKGLNDYELLDHSFEINEHKNRCKLVVAYQTSEIVSFLDSNVLIESPVFYFKDNPFTNKKRLYPVDFGFPFTVQNRVTMRYEGGVSSVQLPENLGFEIPGARYLKSSTSDESGVVVESLYEFSQSLFAPRDYRKVKDFFEVIEKANHEQIILNLGDNN